MFTWAFFAAIPFAFLDWASTWKGWKVRLYISKPATLIFLILWTIQVTHWQGDMVWFGLALVFSLAGDIALLLNSRFFLIGLGSFLLAHLSFLVGFNQQLPTLNIGTIAMAILVGVSAVLVLSTLKPGVLRVPRGKRFLTAVISYGLTLGLMVFSALSTFFRTEWELVPAIFVSCGAVLFYVSDTTLGYDRFVRKLRHGQSYVHLTYHLGQIGLMTGAMIHFMK